MRINLCRLGRRWAGAAAGEQVIGFDKKEQCMAEENRARSLLIRKNSLQSGITLSCPLHRLFSGRRFDPMCLPASAGGGWGGDEKEKPS